MQRAQDPRLCYKDGIVFVVGYTPKGTETYPSIYSSKEEYASQFTSERSRFNGRIVAHTVGSKEYECLTDIIDGADKELNGRWVIMGYGAEDSKTKKKLFVIKEFSNEEGKKAVLEQIDKIAMVHQYGTMDYTLIEKYNSPTESVVLITDGLQDIARALMEATRHAELEEPDAPFTEGKILDLREEELRQ